jgi:hypothetical protein
MSTTSLDNITGPTPTLEGDFIFDTKFNQVQYEAEIWLDNSGGNSINSRQPINPNSIINLTINDTLANWVTQGTITIMYPPEADSAGKTSQYGQNVSSNNFGGKYVFRNDGLDLLRIRLVPKINPVNTGKSYIVQEDKKFWTLSFLFSIYDKEQIKAPQGSINAASNNLEALKLYFWDCWYQRLNTRVLEYSTALSPLASLDKDLDNGNLPQGVLRTGQAIKEIIDTGLNQTPSQTTPGSFIDTSVGGGLGFNYSPTSEIGPNFDIGAAKIFYTAPAFATAYDSLMYVYNKHVCSTNPISTPSTGRQPPRGGRPFSNQVFDFCILKKEKGPSEKDIGQLTLTPVSSIFKQAGNTQTGPGKYQIEHFYVQSYDSDSANKILKAPKGDGKKNNVDITSPGYSYIQSYSFVDIAPATNSEQFCNRPVCSFDYKNRTFNIEFSNNNVLTARKFITERYINNLYKQGQTEKLFLITLEEEKKNLNYIPTFSNDGDNPKIRQSAGLQKLLKIGLFQNTCINFKTPGLPFREAGRFIAIDKISGSKIGEFEDKLYGQWFIIDIKHIFEAELYYNDITAVKIHRFTESPVKFFGTI